jgi:hypothetical protein
MNSALKATGAHCASACHTAAGFTAGAGAGAGAAGAGAAGAVLFMAVSFIMYDKHAPTTGALTHACDMHALRVSDVFFVMGEL